MRSAMGGWVENSDIKLPPVRGLTITKVDNMFTCFTCHHNDYHVKVQGAMVMAQAGHMLKNLDNSSG